MEEKGQEFRFKPLGEMVVLEVPKVKETTESGIIKPESQIKEEQLRKEDYLKVIAVGDEVKTVKVGDKVLISNGRHELYNIDDYTCLFIYERSIMGIKY